MIHVGDPASHERNHCFALTKTWSMDLLTWMKKTVDWCVNQGRTQATSTPKTARNRPDQQISPSCKWFWLCRELLLQYLRRPRCERWSCWSPLFLRVPV